MGSRRLGVVGVTLISAWAGLTACSGVEPLPALDASITPPLATGTGDANAESGGSSGTGDAGADLTGVTAVSAGGGIACALLSGGTVECWGGNASGQIGNGSSAGPDRCDVNPCSTTPAAVSGLSGATAISVGAYNSSCALLSGGTIECWGDNSYGELGNGSTTDGSTTDSNIPVAVPGLSSVTAISAGGEFACALLSAGTVECWGDNEYGELGNGSAIGPDNCTFGSCSTTPVAVAGLSDVTALSVGQYSACALLSGGTVQCWGDSALGELGNGSTTGPDTCHHAVFNTLGSSSSVGGPCSTTPVAVTGLAGVTAISVGGGSACAVLSGGTVQCWGANGVGQLGNGTTTSSSTPVTISGLTGATAVSVGGESACALLSGGTVQCWGDNTFGELGNGSTTGPDSCADGPCSTNPATVSGLAGAAAVSVGVLSACALLTGGTLECWGRNDVGQLGIGATTGPDTCDDDPCSTTPVRVTE